MKKILCMFGLILLTSLSFSQVFKEITTQDNEKIILYNDHTWQYKIEPLSNYLPTSTYPDVIIEKTGFTIGYSKELKQAHWVAYELTKDEVSSKIAARTDNFTPDNRYSTATDKDYLKSGYDRGHLAPAADMGYSIQAMEDCFSYINISPQLPALNRGIWKQLEDKVRGWANEEGSVYVVTGGILQGNMKQLGKGKVAIPNYFYKVILDLTPPCKAIAFVIPNGEITEPLSNYTTTIDNVEKLTNIDFFPQLPDYLENELESQINPIVWGLVTTTGNTNNAIDNATINNSGQSVNKIGAPADSTISTGRCQATTQAGTQCKRNAQPGSKYCWQHQSYGGSSSTVNQKSTTTTKSTGTSSGSTYSGGRTIMTGPKGGTYYINKNGNKTYVKKK